MQTIIRWTNALSQSIKFSTTQTKVVVKTRIRGVVKTTLHFSNFNYNSRLYGGVLGMPHLR